MGSVDLVNRARALQTERRPCLRDPQAEPACVQMFTFLSCDQRANQEVQPQQTPGRHAQEDRTEGTKGLCRSPAVGDEASGERKVKDLAIRPLRGNSRYKGTSATPQVHACRRLQSPRLRVLASEPWKHKGQWFQAAETPQLSSWKE